MLFSKRKKNYNISIDGSKIEHLSSFKYLDMILDRDYTSEKEIRSRIEQARSAFTKMRNLLIQNRS